MKNCAKFLMVSSLFVTSLACAQNYQYGQYPSGQYSSQGYQSYGQPSQYQRQYQNEGGYGGGYGAGNQGYTGSGAGTQGPTEQKQSSSSNWFGGGHGGHQQTQNVPDQVISTRVMQNLRSTPYLSDGAQNIQVTTNDGKVTLKGRVANSNEKNMIEYMVKNVEGVRSVSNDLDTAQ